MQAAIRYNPGSVIPEKYHQVFVQAHSEGKLVKPEDAGHVIAALALHAGKGFSGQFVSWDSEECGAFRATPC